jgi:hypothetical protein
MTREVLVSLYCDVDPDLLEEGNLAALFLFSMFIRRLLGQTLLAKIIVIYINNQDWGV